jgi:hypothetical protein
MFLSPSLSVVNNHREEVRRVTLAGAILPEERPDKKLYERRLLEQMLRRLGWSNVNVEDSERPDFLFSLDSKSIGCELTTLFTVASEEPVEKGSLEARFWNRWIAFAKKLRKSLSTKGEPIASVYGAVHFKTLDYNCLEGVEQQKMIGEIVSLLEESPPLAWFDAFPSDKFPELCHHVDRIWTASVTDECPLWWAGHLRSGLFRDRDAVTTVVNVINKKVGKARDYDWKESEQRWLVIVAPARGIRDNVPWYSGDVYVPEEKELPMPFSNVFLFAWGLGNWYLLQLYPELKYIPSGNEKENEEWK